MLSKNVIHCDSVVMHCWVSRSLHPWTEQSRSPTYPRLIFKKSKMHPIFSGSSGIAV
ncbi:hypothetical protein CKA32_003957 [Geitlerinema sp. FC II]|nr:hypothetical protein CKA32_003957 [Geitlerinema sp. FC II]